MNMDKNDAIKIAADILQSVYTKQSRECHETLAECIVDSFIDSMILNVNVPEYSEFKVHHRHLGKDCQLNTYTQEPKLQNLQ